MKEKKHYEMPTTTLFKVELEGNLCDTATNPQDGEKQQTRHIQINTQEDGGAIDFTTSDNSWD